MRLLMVSVAFGPLAHIPRRRAPCGGPVLSPAAALLSRSATENALAFSTGVGAFRRRAAAATRERECCTRPIKPIATSWCRFACWRTWRRRGIGGMLNGSAGTPHVAHLSNLTAAYELIARAGLTHTRPPFGIDSVMVGNREVAVREEAAHVTPFGTLLRFKKDIEHRAAARAAGRAALGAFRDAACATPCAPCCRSMMSSSPTGTMRATSRRRMAAFGFDDYVEHLITFLEVMGPGSAYRRRLPALCGGSGRDRGDGAGRQCLHAALA